MVSFLGLFRKKEMSDSLDFGNEIIHFVRQNNITACGVPTSASAITGGTQTTASTTVKEFVTCKACLKILELNKDYE